MLRLLEQAGQITLLRVHPRYELQPAFVDRDGVQQKPIVYVADFSYVGMETKDYKIKAKLFRYRYAALVYRVIKAK